MLPSWKGTESIAEEQQQQQEPEALRNLRAVTRSPRISSIAAAESVIHTFSLLLSIILFPFIIIIIIIIYITTFIISLNDFFTALASNSIFIYV